MILKYIDLYAQERSTSVQEGSNAEEQDQMCKTTRLASAKENPLENPKGEMWIRGKVGHMPRNIGINELSLHKLRKGSTRFTNSK